MQVTLAKRYKEQSISRWLMSEKLDGWRAYWTGYELLSRYGNVINAPLWFISKLPEGIALDGELNAGRGRFNFIQSALQRESPVCSEWKKIKFSVFDAPRAPGIFADRLVYVRNSIEDNEVVGVIKHETCYGIFHLLVHFIRLILKGAEGVIIRNPNVPYEQFRSSNMLKLKPRLYADTSIVSALGWLALKLTYK
jgi:DNA ligase-1